MSQMKITPSVIATICETFDNQETQDLLEAMVVELKQDLRKQVYRRRFDDETLEMLIANVQDISFWNQMNLLLNNFSMDF
jgi:hypothetical protein